MKPREIINRGVIVISRAIRPLLIALILALLFFSFDDIQQSFSSSWNIVEFVSPVLFLIFLVYVLSIVVSVLFPLAHLISGDIWPPASSLYFRSILSSIKSNVAIELIWFGSRNKLRRVWDSELDDNFEQLFIGLGTLAIVFLSVILLTSQSLRYDEPSAAVLNATANAGNSTTLSPFFTDPSTVAQIHITLVSISLVIVVFAYEYSAQNMSTFRVYLSFNRILVSVIGSTAVVSILFYIMPLFFQSTAPLETVVTIFLVFSLMIALIATIWLFIRIFAMVQKDRIEVYEDEASFVAQKISVNGSRLVAAERLLNNITNNDLPETNQNNPSVEHIIAEDLELDVGVYITDINLNTLRKALHRDSGPAPGNVLINSGSQIEDREQAVVTTSVSLDDTERDEMTEVLSNSIKTKDWDLFFGFNYFSNEYGAVYRFIDEAEQRSKNSIDTGNISNFNKYIYSYQSVLYSLNLSRINYPEELLKESVDPLLQSLERIFQYAVRSDKQNDLPIRSEKSDIKNRLIKCIIDQTFYMGNEYRRGNLVSLTIISVNNSKISEMHFENLLIQYKEEVQDSSPKVVKYIQSRIDELNRISERQ